MRRRGGLLPAAGIRLFPLLSVLICTTGALVTLLVGFARQGQQALDEAARESGAEQDEREGLEWRIGELQKSRDKTQADLNSARMELSHFEDHLRRLQDRADRLRRAIAEMEKLEPEKRGQELTAAAELERLRGRLRVAEQAVAEAQRDADGKPVKYSVVPYEGPFRTNRRPIYLECRADRVVLQPEGIEFTESDFQGPMGPGNPIASALRAAREYLAAAQPDLYDKQEPYPLLIVRPDAIEAYYHAQLAVQSWGSQFGYELVGADWQLDFPEPDPQMGVVMHAAIADARVRQQQLIAAAPSEYKKAKPSFRVKPNGGGIEVDPASRTARGRGGTNPYKGLARAGAGATGRGGGNPSGANSGGGPGGGGNSAVGNPYGGGSPGTGAGAGAAGSNSLAGGQQPGGRNGPGDSLGSGNAGVGTPGSNMLAGGPGGSALAMGAGQGAAGGNLSAGGQQPGGGNGFGGQGAAGNSRLGSGTDAGGGDLLSGGQQAGSGNGLGGQGASGNSFLGSGTGAGGGDLLSGGQQPGSGNGLGGTIGGGNAYGGAGSLGGNTVAGGQGTGTLPAGTGAGAGSGNSLTGANSGGQQSGIGNAYGGTTGSGNGYLGVGGSGTNTLAGGPGGGGQPGAGTGGANPGIGSAAGGPNSMSGTGGNAPGTGTAANGNGLGTGSSPGNAATGGANAAGGRGPGTAGGAAAQGNGNADGQPGDQSGTDNANNSGTGADGSGATGAAGASAAGGSGGSGPSAGGLGSPQASGNSPTGSGNGAAGQGGKGPASSGSGGQAGNAAGPGGANGPAAQGTGLINGNQDSNLRGTQGGKDLLTPQISGIPTGGDGSSPNSSSQKPSSQSNGQRGGGSQSASSQNSSQSSGSQSGGSPGGQSGSSGSSQDITMPPQSSAVGMPSMNFQKRQPESLAKSRGEDWALPDSSHSSVPVSRPVIIECRADRLVVLADDGKTVSKEILFGQKTTDSVDELRTAVWAHMKDWGAAGKGLYWKPTLSVRVTPDGRARYDELQALFAGSGLDMRESTRTAAPPPPPKKRWWK